MTENAGANGPQGASEVKASESVQKKAAQMGVDLQKVQGSGAEGRILDRDVEKAAADKGATGQAESGQKLVAVHPDFLGEVAREVDGVRYAFYTGSVVPVSQEVYDALPDKDDQGRLVYPLQDAETERGE